MTEYVACPEGCGALLTEQYKSRFGQCEACYRRQEISIDDRIGMALRR